MSFDDDIWSNHGELWRKIIKRELPIKEMLSLKNIEQRHAAIALYGAEQIISKTKAELVSKCNRGYDLYKIKDIEPHLLKYKCPSTGRIYTSFTPRSITDAKTAMAWKYNKTVEEWDQLRIES